MSRPAGYASSEAELPTTAHRDRSTLAARSRSGCVWLPASGARPRLDGAVAAPAQTTTRTPRDQSTCAASARARSGSLPRLRMDGCCTEWKLGKRTQGSTHGALRCSSLDMRVCLHFSGPAPGTSAAAQDEAEPQWR
eukprot:scaffold1042_cov401-Prasinococcus_capsulatus_cf.AAC.18